MNKALLKASVLTFATVFATGVLTVGNIAKAQLATRTLEEYNQSLIAYGVSWKAGSSVYFPSLYAGFAPKIEDANRIHFHLGRGNQARLTANLDEQAVLTYLYNLQARRDFYNSMIQQGIMAPVGKSQMISFTDILASDVYGVKNTTSAFEQGRISKEAFYEASLNIMKRLNPGRVFAVRFDLRQQFLNWKKTAFAKLAAGTKNQNETLMALNDLLPGRINLNFANDQVLARLNGMVQQANNLSDDQFVEQALALFHEATQKRYQFQVLDQGSFRPAVDCRTSGRCDLVATEFTAIYPVGSVKSYTSDRDGNKIPDLAEVGSMNFIERSYHQVDHIRSEPFYGWAPKMDYTESGNGIHNPAVRTSLTSSNYKWLYNEFNIPQSDDTLWVVSRGGVSHGCTRMAAGHIQEVRQIFPSNPEEMKKLVYTANFPSDYDLFDIDGNGELEVMGVDYLIAYALASNSGAGYREGNGFIDEALKKAPFYDVLYGKKQFINQDGSYIFQNPYMSYFSASSPSSRAKAVSVRLNGNFRLYEQNYEKEKLQFIDLPKLRVSSLSSGQNSTNKSQQLMRIYGRINSCGPFRAELPRCNEDAYKNELKDLLQKIK